MAARVALRLSALAGAVSLAFDPQAAQAADSCASDALSVVTCNVSQGLSNAAGNVVQFGADQAERALTKWVVDTAVWLLSQLADVILNTSSPDLGAGWWRAHYADLVAVAWVVAPVFLLLGIVQAILRADLAVFGRILAQLLAVAVLTTGVVALAQLLIGVVDQLSSFVSRNSPSDLHQFLSVFMAGTMTVAMSQPSPVAGASVPLAFLFLAGVVTAIAGVLIWLELLARTLVIYAALLFFPVLLAAAIWPRLTHVLRAFTELLVAVIVSKFILVTIIAAGVAAITATGQQGQGPSLLVGAGLLLVAAWAPWKFYRLLPLMEAGALHHFAAPFRGGWGRWGSRGWRQYGPRRWNSPTRPRGGSLPIAGQNRPGRPPTPGPAGAAGAVATAATAAGAGVRAAGGRVVSGGGTPSPASSKANGSWVRVSGGQGGWLFVPRGSSQRQINAIDTMFAGKPNTRPPRS